jgi:hypothetical protein
VMKDKLFYTAQRFALGPVSKEPGRNEINDDEGVTAPR